MSTDTAVREAPILETMDTVVLPSHDGFAVAEQSKKWFEYEHISDDFKIWFYGMTVEPEGKRKARVSRLVKSTTGNPVSAELLEGNRDSSLGDVWWFLKKGEKGDVWPKVFCVRDTEEIPRLVTIFWLYGRDDNLERCIYARCLESLRFKIEWGTDIHFVSRLCIKT